MLLSAKNMAVADPDSLLTWRKQGMDIWAVNTTFSAKHFPTDFFLPCIKTGAALAFYREERAQGNVNEKEGEQSCSSTHTEAGKSAHGQCGA